MKAIKIILFLSFGLLSFPGISDAQQPLLFNANSIISGDDRTIVIQPSISDSSSIANVSRHLLSLLNSEGYFSSSIDSITTSSENTTQIFFTRGPRSKLNQIIDESDERYCEHLYDSFFSTASIEKCMKSIIVALNLIGYPFAQVAITEIMALSDSEVSVELSVNTGELVSISSLQFVGNKRLNNKILLEITNRDTVSIFNPGFIDESLSRLKRSQYISTATYSGLSKSDSLYNVVFSIQEVRNSSVDLLLGLEPKLDDGYRLVGQGHLTLNHLFVPASSLNLEFNRSGTTESRLSLLYDQFQISRLPIGYGLGVELRQVDSTYLSVESMISTNWRIDPKKSVSFDFDVSTVSGSETELTEFQLSQNRYVFGLAFNFKSFNNWRVPTSGSAFKAKISTGNVDIDDDRLQANQRGGYSTSRFEMHYTHYFPTNERFIIVPTQQFMHTIQDIYYDVDRIRFGGTNSMRGFREDQFRLAGFAMTSIEGRWMLSGSSYLYSFVSGAYTWTPDKLGTINYNLDNSTIFSGGFGISYRVRPGILNVSYAVSNDDSWLNGKIHFGITNSF